MTAVEIDSLPTLDDLVRPFAEGILQLHELVQHTGILDEYAAESNPELRDVDQAALTLIRQAIDVVCSFTAQCTCSGRGRARAGMPDAITDRALRVGWT